MQIFKLITCKNCKGTTTIDFNGIEYIGKCVFCGTNLKAKTVGDEHIYTGV